MVEGSLMCGDGSLLLHDDGSLMCGNDGGMICGDDRIYIPLQSDTFLQIPLDDRFHLLHRLRHGFDNRDDRREMCDIMIQCRI